MTKRFAVDFRYGYAAIAGGVISAAAAMLASRGPTVSSNLKSGEFSREISENEGSTRAALTAIEARLTSVERRPEPVPQQSTPSVPVVPDREGGPRAAEDRRQRHREAMDRLENELEDRALSGTPDRVWSNSIAESVGAHIHPGGSVRLTSVDCSLSVCSVHLVHTGASEGRALVDSLMMATGADAGGRTANGFGGGALLRRRELGDGTFETSLHLARQGESLPSVPSE
jgi:hypothetical protein